MQSDLIAQEMKPLDVNLVDSISVAIEASKGQTSREEVEAIVTKIERIYATARYRAELLERELKRRRDELWAKFERDNAELITRHELAAESAEDMRESYESVVKRLKQLRDAAGEVSARVTPCAEIKQMKTLSYDAQVALKYLVKHNLTQFLQMKVKDFEKAAPTMGLQFVVAGFTPKLFVASDMMLALGLDKQQIEEEVFDLLDSLDRQAYFRQESEEDGEILPASLDRGAPETLDKSGDSLAENSVVMAP